MAIYMVLVPPGAPRGASTPAGPQQAELEQAVFIRDGFSFAALFLSVPFLLVKRMWLVLGVVLAVTVALEAAARFTGSPASGLVSLCASFLLALEANGLHRWTLERRGWRFVAVIEARNAAEAERRFFTGLAAGLDAPGPAPATTPATVPAAGRAGPVPRTGREQVVGLTLGPHQP